MGALVTRASHVANGPEGAAGGCWGLLGAAGGFRGKVFFPRGSDMARELPSFSLAGCLCVDILERGSHLGTMSGEGYWASPDAEDATVGRRKGFLGDITELGANPAASPPAPKLLVMWTDNHRPS